MIERVGWLGATLLAACGVPLVVQTIVDGHARGVSLWFLLMWWAGEVCTLVYILRKARTRQLVTNYLANMAMVSIVLGYRVCA